MDWSNFFSTLKDIIASVDSIIGILIAFFLGLSAWKKQLLSKDKYDLSKRLLRSAYKLRDAIEYVRNPWISITEQTNAAEKVGANIEETQKDHNKSIKNVYFVRWQKIAEALSDLDTESLEAEVFWGKDATKAQEHLRSCVKELSVNLNYYLNMVKEVKVDFDVIYDSMDRDNTFNVKIKNAIEDIKIFLEPHLKIKK